MRFQQLAILFLFFLLISCRKEVNAPLPDTTWLLFNSPGTVSLPTQSRVAMEGVYQVKEGSSVFGKQVVLKWSFVASGLDTNFYLSFFCEKDIAYFDLEGKVLGDSILFNGYWRALANTESGIARFIIAADGGAKRLLSQLPQVSKDSITINGIFGNGQETPTQKMVLIYQRPLYKGNVFEILAHRSGGRTSDHLPYAENSIGMIQYASQLGATGIELDIRLTRDGIPILYHDNTLNLRLIQKNGLVGPVESYSYDQLSNLVLLVEGERIPTLRQALETALSNTSLHFIWLDTKYDDSINDVQALQSEFLEKAKASGRSLEIVIGLPGEDQVAKFRELSHYDSVPSLCETSLQDVTDINARVWAPRWTLGLQNDLVQQVKSEGRRVFVWTLDVPDYIDQFINQGHFDGILSNYPSLVAYYYYVKE